MPSLARKVSRYLERIRYEGSLEPTPMTLRALHLAHLRSVPFENLDIHLGRPIILDMDRLFDKIVVMRRGGFCYELNSQFGWLLEQLGVGVTYLSANDIHADGSSGPEFDHLTLLVQCSGNPAQGTRWLADVGWGDSFTEPLRFDDSKVQVEGLRAYRLDHEDPYYRLWQRNYDGHWEHQYRFTLQPHVLADFADMCHYHQTSPESIFVKNRICTLATVDGRISLDNSRLISTTNGVRKEQPVTDEDSFRRLLAERFGVTLE